MVTKIKRKIVILDTLVTIAVPPCKVSVILNYKGQIGEKQEETTQEVLKIHVVRRKEKEGGNSPTFFFFSLFVSNLSILLHRVTCL